jgi:hypothetical protein
MMFRDPCWQLVQELRKGEDVDSRIAAEGIQVENEPPEEGPTISRSLA